MTNIEIQRKSSHLISKIYDVTDIIRELNTGEADKSFARNMVSIKKQLFKTCNELRDLYERDLKEVLERCLHKDTKVEDIGQGHALVCQTCQTVLSVC